MNRSSALRGILALIIFLFVLQALPTTARIDASPAPSFGFSSSTLDTTSPRVVATSPSPGATKIAPTISVVAVFSESVNGVDNSSFALYDSTTEKKIAATVSYDPAHRIAKLTPSEPLLAGHQYTAELSDAIVDDAGNPLIPIRWAFLTAPTVTSQAYTLKAILDYPNNRLSVVETLEWTNRTSSSVDFLNLSVIPAAVQAFSLNGDVTADGLKAAVTWKNTNMRVNFVKPLPPGATIKIIIPFNLKLGTYSGAFGARFGRYNNILSFGEWFPIWSVEHNLVAIGDPQVSWNADSIVLDLESTTRLGKNAVASSGKATLISDNHWIFRAYNVRDFAFTVYPGYRLCTGTIGNTQIRAYTRLASCSTMLSQVKRAFAKYNSWFGAYPYPTFTIAEVGSKGFAMEFPQMVFIGADLASQALVVYHEVSHQWWYGLVGNNQITDPFFDEGLATFASRYALGKSFKACSTRNIDLPATSFKGWMGCNQYVETIYRRGAVFMNAVRARLGNTAFFAALKSFQAKYRYGVSTTFQLLDYLEAWNKTSIASLVRAYTSR